MKTTFLIIFSLGFMMKKYLKKTFEKYKSKNKLNHANINSICSSNRDWLDIV